MLTGKEAYFVDRAETDIYRVLFHFISLHCHCKHFYPHPFVFVCLPADT